MSNFPSGSAWALVKDVAEGYYLVTERTFRRLSSPELDKLLFELNRNQREIRGEQPGLEDQGALQLRNRKLQRLNQAVQMLRAYRQKRRV